MPRKEEGLLRCADSNWLRHTLYRLRKECRSYSDDTLADQILSKETNGLINLIEAELKQREIKTVGKRVNLINSVLSTIETTNNNLLKATSTLTTLLQEVKYLRKKERYNETSKPCSAMGKRKKLD